MSHLQLLRAAVEARLAYWDAISALEKSLLEIHPEGSELSDKSSDKINEFIDIIAAGCDDTGDIDGLYIAPLVNLVEVA